MSNKPTIAHVAEIDAPSFPEHVLDGLRVEDALSPEVQLFGRGGAQALLGADVQEIHAETPGHQALDNSVPTQDFAFHSAFLPSFQPAFEALSLNRWALSRAGKAAGTP